MAMEMEELMRKVRLMRKTSVWCDHDYDYDYDNGEAVRIEDYIDVDGNPKPEVVAYGLVKSFPYNCYPVDVFHHNGKYTAEKMEQKIQMMREWAEKNPAPANIFLITGDEDYSDIVAELRSRDYNILVAYSRAQGISPLVKPIFE